MPHIKELVIRGFKSFAREIKIPFQGTMNVIVGPNGSGKSNITDAICFVLGRLGSKSMRAKKLSNLIFAGTQKYKPGAEANVELIFDNSDGGFSVSDKTVSIKRILRRNGQSIYKINNEVKTRQEVLELMAQAGIDPNGFNIVLQGEIDSFVKMAPDKRREVIEEVAGISVYEVRKKRSLKELERTEQRMKEVSAILRERNAYLRNLEEERKQALKYKKLQEDLLSAKASILHKTIKDREQKVADINKQIDNHQVHISKINELIEKNNAEIQVLNDKIQNISENIQKSSGLEQERLNSEISDIRADIAGLSIRRDNLANSQAEMTRRTEEIEANIAGAEEEIEGLRKSKGKTAKKDLEAKKQKLEEIDERRRRLYVLKSSLAALAPRIEDKQRQIQKNKNESDFVLGRIEQIESEIKIKDSLEEHREASAKLKNQLIKLNKSLEDFKEKKADAEKSIAISEQQISEATKVRADVSSIDTCPLCKTKITKDHVEHVLKDAEAREQKGKDKIRDAKKTISELDQEISKSNEHLRKVGEELKIRAQDMLRLELINEKKSSLRRFSEEKKDQEEEMKDLGAKKTKLESDTLELRSSEAGYDALRLEVQELERQGEKSSGMEATLKQRDVERMKNLLRQTQRELEDNEEELAEIREQLEEKQESLEQKNQVDQDLKRRFQKILAEKTAYQEKIRFFESDILHKQADKNKEEEASNNLKIDRAQVAAQKEAAEEDYQEYKGAKILRLPTEALKKKVEETQRILDNLGSVNMRALEVYEDFKKEYDKIQERVDKLDEEKEEIFKVIEDIDKKKKKAFITTLTEINQLFSRNFSQLSTKGIAMLEPTNREDLFEGGIEMLIKVGKGKYFDTHSLSGGEQSLISLSLIFAIQEYKPYCFYIFDEIDAALDRRNSERLAALLKKYMKHGQYLIITHNDSLITEAPVIYGVSMQDKVSTVLSLEV